MLQIIYLLALLFCFQDFKSINKYNYLFYEASLLYLDHHYTFTFKPIDKTIEKIMVTCDGNEILNLHNIRSLERIDFPFLDEGTHKIMIQYKHFHELLKRIDFNINIPSEVDITNKSYFSMNNLIDDYQKRIEFIENQYLKIDQLSYELIQDSSYIKFKNFGEFIYDKKYMVTENIEYIIYNPSYFFNIPYDEGYHFSLDLGQVDHKNYLIFYSIMNSHQASDELYLPKESYDNIIDSRVIIHDIFGTGIDVYFNQIIDIKDYLFGKYGEYEIYIKDR